MAQNTGRPWYKITFDPYLPGDAKVLRNGYRRRVKIPGQWLVFDKDVGEYSYGTAPILFASGDIAECHAWIDARR